MLIILDVDNLIFMSILTLEMPPDLQRHARRSGLFIGIAIRMVLLSLIGWIVEMDEHPLFHVADQAYTLREVILFLGGSFLIYKSTVEIHKKLEGQDDDLPDKKSQTLGKALVQLSMINLIFSVDSVITAVGMTKHIPVMLVSVLISMTLMYIFQMPIGRFVAKHPTFKILALSFLLLIGVLLVGEGTHFPVPKGYIYFAMAFSFGVELLNLRIIKQGKPVHLHGPDAEKAAADIDHL
jgi:predicted tellurium resistance membrane protein TerC